MICPVCRCQTELLACPNCANRRSDQALWRYQRDPIARVLEGKLTLLVRVLNYIRHFQMYGAEKTFCGQPVSPRSRLMRRGWGDCQSADYCALCQGEIRRIERELEVAKV